MDGYILSSRLTVFLHLKSNTLFILSNLSFFSSLASLGLLSQKLSNLAHSDFDGEGILSSSEGALTLLFAYSPSNPFVASDCN